MSNILVIDDEEHIQELLKFNLEVQGHIVDCTRTGIEGIDKAKKNRPDLIILDWMLPEISGIEFMNKIKSDSDLYNIPIIMLTAKNMEDDKITGLDNGADDFITKPFSIKELMARIKTVLRRYDMTKIDKRDDRIEIGNIIVDMQKMEVIKDGTKVDLTLKEFELLKLLIKNPGRVISREEILDKVWGYEFYGETRTVDVHIRYLRKKLNNNTDDKIIETIRGVGYKFNA